MKSSRVEVTEMFEKSLDSVWNKLQKAEQWDQWIEGCKKFSWSQKSGWRKKAEFSVKFGSIIYHAKVLRFEKGTLEWKGEGRGYTLHSGFRLEGTKKGTQVTYYQTVNGPFHTFLMLLGRRDAFEARMRKHIEQSLQQLKQACEQQHRVS